MLIDYNRVCCKRKQIGPNVLVVKVYGAHAEAVVCDSRTESETEKLIEKHNFYA
jgi:hypothetical protein